MREPEMQIGYVGLGAMGGALARRLLREHSLVVFDINHAAVAQFEKAGAAARLFRRRPRRQMRRDHDVPSALI